ncbi:MAG TPA: glycosyltransferase family 2 protein [bacterium]|nr:glycosyltransferase family 2 protein [bacterium]
MLEGRKVIVVMPAYNSQETIEKTYNDIPRGIVDEILLTDDHSTDQTVEVARRLGLQVFVHEKNLGYGANQKTCYREALRRRADIIIMLHPDYQYPPKLITAMAGLICSDMFDVVLGSRILGGMARKGGMPGYKYIANRALTLLENMLMGQKLAEYHTGYRAFSRSVLINLPLLENSDDFVFDNQMLAQAAFFGYRIGEITSPTNYAREASSINFRRSVVYGLGVLATSVKFFLQKHGLGRFAIYDPTGRKLVS